MSLTVRLSAESKYGFHGQYIAKLVGRAPKVQFDREFCGWKVGKRDETTSYETDETGLYEVCDVTKSGKQKTYKLVLPWKDGLRVLMSDCEDALAIAKRLGAGERIEDVVVAERGDALTIRQYYRECSECGRESSSEDPCPDHPNATWMGNFRDIPDLSADGKQLYALVYTIRTPGEAKRAMAAASIDGAVMAIVEALSALPATEKKSALAAAKARLFPPTPKEPPTNS